MAREDLTRLTRTVNGPNCDDDDCPNVYRTATERPGYPSLALVKDSNACVTPP